MGVVPDSGVARWSWRWTRRRRCLLLGTRRGTDSERMSTLGSVVCLSTKLAATPYRSWSRPYLSSAAICDSSRSSRPRTRLSCGAQTGVVSAEIWQTDKPSSRGNHRFVTPHGACERVGRRQPRTGGGSTLDASTRVFASAVVPSIGRLAPRSLPTRLGLEKVNVAEETISGSSVWPRSVRIERAMLSRIQRRRI